MVKGAATLTSFALGQLMIFQRIFCASTARGGAPSTDALSLNFCGKTDHRDDPITVLFGLNHTEIS